MSADFNRNQLWQRAKSGWLLRSGIGSGYVGVLIQEQGRRKETGSGSKHFVQQRQNAGLEKRKPGAWPGFCGAKKNQAALSA
ncbi:MAG: hypothetical protein HGA71_15905 [Azonexaceae bacterium]|nr:hypothetical protein [Azonexaceae bacterium]